MTAHLEQPTSDLATPEQPAPVGQDARVEAVALHGLADLEKLVEALDGKTICIRGEENTFIDDGVIVASDFQPAIEAIRTALAAADRASPDNAAAVMAERERCLAIVKCRIDLWNKAVSEGCHDDCSMSLAEECEDIHAAIRNGPR